MSRSSDHDARNKSLREAFSSTKKARAALVPTAATVPATCKDLGLPWHVEDIPESEGARIHWIGDTRARHVLLYFHGGGFGLSAFPGHIGFLASCMERASTVGTKMVTAFLEYGLTPTKSYPVQYLQATEALRHVLDKGYAPDQIIVGGDSAGGNMVLGLLSILNHPHPSIPGLKLDTPLQGAILICPWVSFSADWESYKLSAERDIHSGESMLDWTRDFLGPHDSNNYSEPIRADTDWWSAMPVASILLVWGEYELFRDSNAKIAETLASAGANVKQAECDKQVHIDCILDSQTDMEPGPMSTTVWDWVENIF